MKEKVGNRLERKKSPSGKKPPETEQPGVRKTAANYLTGQIVRLLARTHISPDAVTWFGFILALAAAALIATGHLFAAGWVVIIGGFFDMLDGALARITNKVTRFGGILDSTLDRLSEAALLLALMAYYARTPSTSGVLITGLALVGSLMVSYIRSRTETAGVRCEVGIFTRPERVIVLTLGLLLSGINNVLTIALVIIAVLSFVTVIQRVVTAWRQTRNLPGP
jgi:CDP-diacylglycerol--glycerol-3-phosphate 3-phosphatidyltransferase